MMSFLRGISLIGLVFVLQSRGETPRLAVQIGHGIILNCTISYHLETTWMRNAPDETPTIIMVASLQNDGNLRTNYQLDCRFTPISLNRSIALKIDNITDTDLALYYCAGIAGKTLHFGKGVRIYAVTERSGFPLSFYPVYAGLLGSGQLVMILVVLVVHLKTYRRPKD